MDFETAYNSLKSKFESGNEIPVERTVITKKEWDAVQQEIEGMHKKLLSVIDIK